MARVGVIHHGPPNTFVRRDIEILSREHEVSAYRYDGVGDSPGLLSFASDQDMLLSWFGDAHAAFGEVASRVWGPPHVVIVGGYDAADVPEIGYGAWQGSRLRRRYTRFALRGADRVLVVDPSLRSDLERNAGIDVGHVDYLPTGYDTDYWSPSPDAPDEDTVLTVGTLNEEIVRRKGIDTFVDVAREVPEAQFVVVGKHADETVEALRSDAPQNVEFTGFVEQDVLRDWYRRAQVYCQLSRYEGLPNALCEAMLCGCVPVGTEHCGIPEAIGETGFYVPFGDVRATAGAVRKALEDGSGDAARRRIAEKFPEDRRRDGLLAVVEDLVDR